MLRLLPSSHDNRKSMVIYHSCMKHSTSVVIVTCKRTEHGYISLTYETCSVSCLRLMTTVRAWLYIIHVWTMLCQLSSSKNIGQSMIIYHSCMKHALSAAIVPWQRTEHGYSSEGMLYAPSVVILSWQRSEHGYITFIVSKVAKITILRIGKIRALNESAGRLFRAATPVMSDSCSFRCHSFLTTDRACLYIPKVLIMHRHLSSSHYNGQSRVIYPSIMKHAPPVIIVLWQRSEHGNISLVYETCSISCHRLMTTVRAWLFLAKEWIMLHQLLSSQDNCQSMVIYP